jgi:cyclopropane fatty-acyl-phospholipid synthase-like methyltransferase
MSEKCSFIFDDTPLAGADVLDIGAGAGLLSLWAALNGAASVTSLEPEVSGSTKGTRSTLQELVQRLDLGSLISVANRKIQEFDATKQFDVVVLYNVVNHVDEDATRTLHEDSDSQRVFRRFFDSVAQVTRPGGGLVLADNARSNLWGRFGLRSPFNRTLEWDIHQDPEVWARLLEDVGFSVVRVRWSPVHRLGRAGRVFGSRLGQFVASSHFVMTLNKL